MTERQWYERWKGVVRAVLSIAGIDKEEATRARIKRIAGLEADPEEWFNYYFPKYAFAPAAKFHKEATSRVLKHTEWFEVRMWSRELAKSTRTMMEVLYLTLVGYKPSINKERIKKRYVLLISNSMDNATRLLAPYKACLEGNDRIIQDYGVQECAGSWQAGEFTTELGVAFRAMGVGQSPRGARNEEVRPDIILFDDVDTDADCMNSETVARKWRWIEEAAIGTRSISCPTTIIFCGNRIAKDCCIERAKRQADFVDEWNIRDGAGRSTWSEKNSETDIDRVLSQKSYAAAQKEYFNNPITEGSVFKQMAYKPARPISEYDVLVCYTDPSYKDTNDYKATVLVGKWENEYHVIKCYLAQTTTAEMISWHYNIMNIVGDRCCYYYMEDVFMQDVLVKEVSDAGRKTGRHIPIRGDKRKKPDKFMRIESLLEPLQRNGALYLNAYERHNSHMERLEEQFINCAPGNSAHDDGPDAVEGAVWMINQKQANGIGSGAVAFAKTGNKQRY